MSGATPESWKVNLPAYAYIVRFLHACNVFDIESRLKADIQVLWQGTSRVPTFAGFISVVIVIEDERGLVAPHKVYWDIGEGNVFKMTKLDSMGETVLWVGKSVWTGRQAWSVADDFLNWLDSMEWKVVD